MATLAAGSRLGPYEILSALGAGGMGEVYRARDTRLRRDVAVKVLPGSFSTDADRLRRFEQEALAASALNHPNILTIYDVGEQDGAPYVVAELLEGETLRDRMAGGALAPKQALGLALQMAHGLAAAHERGIVHRDLKPENVFVTRDGRVKILDFGLAKLVEAPGAKESDVPTATPDTGPGVVLGTLGYMSPEQVRGKPADARSDIFSFGTVLYEMLSGRRAFRGETAADTMSAILTKEPAELSSTNQSVSPGLDRVVRHCLEKEPARRFHSAHDLAYDLEALSETSASVSAVAPRSAPSWKRVALPVVIALVVVTATLLWLRRSKAGGAGGDVLDSVAVLPFVNASPDPETEYLSDGITEAIINSLSSLPNLRVSPRSRVFRYKGKEDDPQKIGRELNVRAVVSGKVLPRDGRLSIQADLVDIGKGSQIWGDQYDRPMSEILAIQEEIARDVSEKLRVQMSGAEVEKLKKRPTGNIEAYQTYLKGRHAWEKRGARDLQQAIEYFQKAIELDPSFALAYSGLAGVYAVLPSYNQMAPADASERVKATARKALEIDEGIAPAHAALGLALSHYDREFAPAEAAYRRAITLDPNDATAHHWYAMLLSATERSEEAIAEIEKARELDPFSMVIRSNVVRVLAQARRHDEALERARQMAREFPDFAAGHFFLGLALEQKGQLPDAAASFLKATSLAAAPLQKLFYRAHSEALRGRMGDLRATIREVETIAETRYVSSTSMAVLYLLAGDKDQGLALLERGLEEGDYAAIFLPVDRQFDELRSDPRFAEILRRSRMPVRR